MASEKPDVMKFLIDVDASRAQKTVAVFTRLQTKSLKAITQSSGDTNKGMENLLKASKRFGTEFSKKIKLSTDMMDHLNNEMKALPQYIDKARRAEEKHVKVITAKRDALQKLKVEQSNAAKGSKEAEGYKVAVKVAQRELESKEAAYAMARKTTSELEKQASILDNIEKNQKGTNFTKVFEEASEEMASNLRREMEGNFKDLVMFDGKKTRQALSDGMSEAVGSLKAKDFGGVVKGLGSMLGGGMKGAAGKLTRVGMAAKADPAASGMAKALGGLAGKMGPMLETFAKMGPMLSAVSGGIMAMVKLFIDAQAQVKEFNSQILATASTGEFMADNFNNADAAAEELTQTLDSIRNSAFDAKQNLAWGTTGKDHAAFLNVLNAEGVSLKRISEEAAAAGKSSGQFSADMVHAAVAYSRTMGVSLNEVASLQTEMMGDLGMSFESAKKEFAEMERSSAESGIAQNKFFNIIKSVSSDLSLYNMRMEDSVHLLTLLGKTMNPRNAQKFMQETMQGFKNMGRTEKLKMTLLAGEGKTREILEKDMVSKTQDVSSKIRDALKDAGQNVDVKDIEAAVKSGSDAAEKYIGMVPKQLQGDFRDAVTQMDIDRKRMGKGTFGTATATGNLGMGGVLDMYKAAIGRFGGGSNLEDAAGSIGGEMIAEQLGVSQEKLDSMIKLERAVKMQQKKLVQEAKDAGKSDEEIAKIDKMGTQDIIASMSQSDQEKLKQETKVENYAKQQTDLTMTVTKQLEILIDFLMNEYYNVIVGIWDTILDFPGLRDKNKKANLDFAKTVKSVKDSEVTKAATAAGGDRYQFRAQIVQTEGYKKIEDALDGLNKGAEGFKKSKDTRNALFQSGDVGGAALDEAKNNETIRKKLARAQAEKMVKLAYPDADEDYLSKRTDDMAGIYEKQMKEGNFQGTIDRSTVENDAGLYDEDLNKIAKKIVWHSDPDQFAKSFAGIRDTATGGPAAPAPGTPGAPATGTTSPTGQTAATDKAKMGGTNAPTAATTGSPAAGQANVSNAVAKLGGGPIATAAVSQGVGVKADEMPANTKQADQTISSIEDVQTKLNKVKLDKPFMKNEFQARVEAGVLDAVRTALLEYYLYSGLDKTELLKSGAQGSDVPHLLDEMRKPEYTGGGKTLPVGFKPDPSKHATGGMVLKPPAGEAFASVAPGETIVPKGGFGGGGGGAGTVNQTFQAGVDPNFAKYIDHRTKQAIVEWNRKAPRT